MKVVRPPRQSPCLLTQDDQLESEPQSCTHHDDTGVSVSHRPDTFCTLNNELRNTWSEDLNLQAKCCIDVPWGCWSQEEVRPQLGDPGQHSHSRLAVRVEHQKGLHMQPQDHLTVSQLACCIPFPINFGDSSMLLNQDVQWRVFCVTSGFGAQKSSLTSPNAPKR